MKKSSKAALLSMLVFPGAGQLLLKRYFSACIFFTITLMLGYQLISDAFNNAMQIVDKIGLATPPLDIATINELIATATSNNASISTSNIGTILALTWLIAIADCLRIKENEA